MKFVADLSIPDRSPVPPGAVLVKRWKVENDNAMAAWPEGAKLIFVRGDRALSDAEEFAVTRAQPGQQVEVSAVLRTPTIPGRYQAFFRLADADRTPFGARLWADLFVVAEPAAPSTPAVAAPAVSTVITTFLPPPPAAAAAPAAPVAAPASAPALASSPSPHDADPAVPAAAAAASKYALAQSLLEEMGFRNRELNLFLLDRNNGDVPTVATWLLKSVG